MDLEKLKDAISDELARQVRPWEVWDRYERDKGVFDGIIDLDKLARAIVEKVTVPT